MGHLDSRRSCRQMAISYHTVGMQGTSERAVSMVGVGEIMELARLWRGLARYWWLLIVGALITSGASYWVVRSVSPLYQTSVKLVFNPAPLPGITNVSDPAFLERVVKTYSELLQSRPLLEEAIQQLGLPLKASDLAQRVSLRNSRESQVMQIVVQDSQPDRAAAIANRLATLLVQSNRDLQTTSGQEANRAATMELASIRQKIDEISKRLGQLRSVPGSAAGTPTASDAESSGEISRLQGELTQYQELYFRLLETQQRIVLAQAQMASSVSIIEPAPVPLAPIWPQTSQTVILAGLVGLLLTSGLALFLDYRDRRLRQPDEIRQRFNLQLLASVPPRRRAKADGAPRDERAELESDLQLLGTNLKLAGRIGPLVVAITSPTSGEGRSTIAAHLATGEARAGRRVIVVEADLGPADLTAENASTAGQTGLSTYLAATDATIPTLQEGQQGIRIIAGGPPRSDLPVLLSSRRMARLVEELRGLADIVIIDSPAILTGPAMLVLRQHVDGVILVLDARRSHQQTVAEAIERLQPTEIFGFVFNHYRETNRALASWSWFGRLGNRSLKTPSLGAPALLRPAGALATPVAGALRQTPARQPAPQANLAVEPASGAGPAPPVADAPLAGLPSTPPKPSLAQAPPALPVPAQRPVVAPAAPATPPAAAAPLPAVAPAMPPAAAAPPPAVAPAMAPAAATAQPPSVAPVAVAGVTAADLVPPPTRPATVPAIPSLGEPQVQTAAFRLPVLATPATTAEETDAPRAPRPAHRQTTEPLPTRTEIAAARQVISQPPAASAPVPAATPPEKPAAIKDEAARVPVPPASAMATPVGTGAPAPAFDVEAPKTTDAAIAKPTTDARPTGPSETTAVPPRPIPGAPATRPPKPDDLVVSTTPAMTGGRGSTISLPEDLADGQPSSATPPVGPRPPGAAVSDKTAAERKPDEEKTPVVPVDGAQVDGPWRARGPEATPTPGRRRAVAPPASAESAAAAHRARPAPVAHVGLGATPQPAADRQSTVAQPAADVKPLVDHVPAAASPVAGQQASPSERIADQSAPADSVKPAAAASQPSVGTAVSRPLFIDERVHISFTELASQRAASLPQPPATALPAVSEPSSPADPAAIDSRGPSEIRSASSGPSTPGLQRNNTVIETAPHRPESHEPSRLAPSPLPQSVAPPPAEANVSPEVAATRSTRGNTTRKKAQKAANKPSAPSSSGASSQPAEPSTAPATYETPPLTREVVSPAATHVSAPAAKPVPAGESAPVAKPVPAAKSVPAGESAPAAKPVPAAKPAPAGELATGDGLTVAVKPAASAESASVPFETERQLELNDEALASTTNRGAAALPHLTDPPRADEPERVAKSSNDPRGPRRPRSAGRRSR